MAYRGSGFGQGGGSSLFGLRREIDRLFEDAFGGARASTVTWAPAVDVREDGKEISLDLELPGISPQNVEINVENGVLSIRGEKRVERKEGEDARYHVVERTYGTFFRSFQLPQGVDEGQITAEFNNGVLSVRIPKAALPQPRKIQIAGGQQVSGAQQQKVGAGTQRGREQQGSRTGTATEPSRGTQRSGQRMVAEGGEGEEE